MLLVGPGQERWIGIHRSVAPDEVDAALARVIVAAGGDLALAAAHLNVRPEYLARAARRRALRAAVEAARAPGAMPVGLPAYAPPSERADARAVVAFRGPRSSCRWRGAWRVEGLLAQEATRAVALDTLRSLSAGATTAREMAAAIGVSPRTLVTWAQRWPEVAALVREVRQSRVVSLRRRPLTLEQAIDYVSPFVPASPGQLNARLREAAWRGTLPYPVRATSRQLVRYVGRRDARGRMIVRVEVSRDRHYFEWRVVETGGADA